MSGLRRSLWLFVSAVLAFSLGLVGPVWADPVPVDEAPVERPDWVSASVTAKASGVRVEVLSERSETGRVWVHPDGSVEEEQATAAVRFVDDEGLWRDIDTALAAGEQGAGPVALPFNISVGAGELVAFDEGGEGEVLVALPGVVLPEPVLDGPVAVFPEVFGGVDVSVEVRSAGFEVLWIVKTPEAAADLMAQFGDGAGQLRMPLQVTSAGGVQATEFGGVVVMGADGTEVGGFSEPAMWDSSSTDSGEGVKESVEFELQTPVARRGGTVTGGVEVQVVADEEWLLAPERVFPVVIDPTYQMVSGAPTFDTFVAQGVTTDQSSAAELKLGLTGSSIARSYMNFDASLFKGRQVVQSTLSLYESWSYNCTARAFSVWAANPASTASRWTAQPTATSKYATLSVAAGYSSSCPGARVQLDTTTFAQAASATTATHVGMMLRADSETDVVAAKRFHSSEGQNKPVISVRYNRMPNIPVAPSIKGLASATVQGGAVKKFIGATKPLLSVPVSDADLDNVQVQFAYFTQATGYDTRVDLCRTGYVASGGTASCTATVNVPDNKTIWIRATAHDSRGWSGWGPAVEVRTALNKPQNPVITCPTSNGSWSTTVKPKETCIITMPVLASQATSAATEVRWSINGGATQKINKTQPTTTSPNSHGVEIGGTPGSHVLKAYLQNPGGHISATITYSFGYGKPSITYPKSHTITHGEVKVDMSGQPKGAVASVTGSVQWRIKGSGPTAWTTTTSAVDVTTTDDATKSQIVGRFNVAALAGLRDSNGAGVMVPERGSVLLELRGCFAYSGAGTNCTDPVQIIRVPHAFGSGFPVTSVGDGDVAMWTGEFQTTALDVSLATPDGSLDVTRTYSTFAGESDIATSVFGPGWVSSIDAYDMGTGGLELLDNTLVDGTLVLASPDGTFLPFSKSASRRTSANIEEGSYLPIGPDAEASGLKIDVLTEVDPNNNTSSIIYCVIDEFGTRTNYRARVQPDAGTRAVFEVVSITDQVAAQTVAYSYDSSNRIKSITAALPDGITTCPTTGSAHGCRVLRINYNTSGLVSSIVADVNGEPTRTLTTYTYSSGRLASATDAVSGLTTTYTTATTTTGQTRLTSITHPGLAKTTYSYDTTGKLSKVTRPNPTTAGGGTAQLAAFVYDLTPASIGGLENVTDQFASYDLGRTPTKAFAAFGPDAPITTAPVATSTLWQRAGVWLTDDEGYTIHEANHGAGQWQLTAYVYDQHGNVVRSWDTRATEAIRTGVINDSNAMATESLYNEDILDSEGELLVPAGLRIVEHLEPAIEVARSSGQAPELLRRQTLTFYDEGAPTPGISLPTKSVSVVKTMDGAILENYTTTTFIGYDGTTLGGTKTGWELGQATSSTLDMNHNGVVDAEDLTSVTVYDDRGRTVQERKPGSTGTDAATRETIYWNATTNPRDPACGMQPGWAGFVCKTGPAAQPAGTPYPVTVTSGYRWNGQAAQETETSGAVTRTVVTSFDAKSRPQTVTTTVTGLPASLPIPAVTTTYDNNTGLATGTTSAAGTTTLGFDSWGRQVTYTTTPAGQAPQTTTTVYDAIGDMVSRTTPTATTNYTWDGTDANGHQETRGLLTAVSTTASGYTATASAAYDAHGALTLEKLPGGIIRRETYDLTGELTQVAYNGTTNDPVEGVQEDQAWVAWTLTANAAGQIVSEETPEGAALIGSVVEQAADVADITYAYDPAGRLTTVTDHATPSSTGEATCSVRTYQFDQRGNRTHSTTTTATPGDDCPNPAPADTTNTWTHDGADRVLTGANNQGTYTYDNLGRQTIIPAADAPDPASGDIQLDYYDDDSARRIRQADHSIEYTLDAAGRRTTQATYQGTGNTLVEEVTNHYTDDTDNPGWITHTTDGVTATTVYTDLASFSITTNPIDGTQGELALTTPRGDIAATITLTTGTTPATGLDSWTRYTEYGTPTTPQPTGTTGTAAGGYGWLGTHQRTTTEIGILLMGARLYNPATALFTSIDPVWGGNETAYTYPNDPVQLIDVSGKFIGFLRAIASALMSLSRQRSGVLSSAQVQRFRPVRVTRVQWARIAIPKQTGFREWVKYSLYEVLTKKGRTWKYGITMQVPFIARAAAGVRECNASGSGPCKPIHRGYRQGYYNARLWEYGQLVGYAMRNKGKCPPGHREWYCK